MWLGGTYVPFLGTIIAAVLVAAAAASTVAVNSLIIVGLGGALGAYVGRQLALRAARDHPVEARALQVFLGVTDDRVIVFEPRSIGKPGRLLSAFPVSQVGNLEFRKGGFFRPSRMSFFTPVGEHRYEFSGLWDVSTLLDALGGR